MISLEQVRAVIVARWPELKLVSDVNNDTGHFSDARFDARRQTRLDDVYAFMVEDMAKRQIDTPLRMAMYVAQAAHETGGFRWLRELASGQAYENRADLGNNQPGDGVKYAGRGVFQLTGRGNYTKCSAALGLGTLLLDRPELVEEPGYACKTAGWFWDLKGLSKLADAGDVLAVTKRINGGTNGLTDRMALFRAACVVQGVRQ